MQPSLFLSQKCHLVECSFHSGPSSVIISNDGFQINSIEPTKGIMEHRSLDSTSSCKFKLVS